MIVYFWQKRKDGATFRAHDKAKGWGIMLLVLLVSLYVLFVWGKILLRQGNTLQIVRSEAVLESRPVANDPVAGQGSPVAAGAFVASKKGKYYYPSGCSRAKSLSVQNMLYFKDKMDAEAAGYQAFSGCK